MSKEKREDIVIFNIRIANELIERGYPIKKLRMNDKRNNRLVALFDNTKELREDLEEHFNIIIR